MSQERPRKRKKPPMNPLIRGITAFYEGRFPGIAVLKDDFDEDGAQRRGEQPVVEPTDTMIGKSKVARSSNNLSILDIPRRYTFYPPLLLLPSNFSSSSPRWAALYGALDEKERSELFNYIAEEGFGRMGISTIAINAPIAAETETYPNDDGSDTEDRKDHIIRASSCEPGGNEMSKQDNVLRSPSGLVPVYGDWGPTFTPTQHRSRILHPTVQDFDQAFWTSTSQHEGIIQVWAPLYTMFSRGNISEKARILGLHSLFPGLTTAELGNQRDVTGVDVVDFYVGVGYFAFCYLKRGIRRVYGWDINPWSIEGLKRGCERNGWRCEVVEVDQIGNVKGEGGVRALASLLGEGGEDGREESLIRCVAFLGDNKWAAKVLEQINDEFKRLKGKVSVKQPEINVRHANLGLLPTSRASWSDSVRILTGMSKSGRGGWAHIHQNVDVREIEDTSKKIAEEVAGLVKGFSGGRRFDVSCAHVEQVKSFAPGVVHCVYDIEIKSNG